MNDPASLHRHAWDLIPWVVNGTADGAQRRLVEQHMAHCPDCRDEHELHTCIHAGIEARPVEPHSADPAWRRLEPRLADGARASRPGATPRDWPSWTRVLIAASVLQAVGLGALGALLWQRSQGADYETLSEPAQAAGPVAFRFVPAPDMTMEQFQSLLARAGLQVVDTSGEGGIYKLGLPPGGDAFTAANALETLRAAPGVLLAEPLKDTR